MPQEHTAIPHAGIGAAGPLRVAVIGRGPDFDRILALFCGLEGRGGAGRRCLLAAAAPLAASESGLPGDARGHESVEGLLKAHPDLNVVVCLGDPELATAVRPLLPPGAALVDEAGASVLLDLAYAGDPSAPAEGQTCSRTLLDAVAAETTAEVCLCDAQGKVVDVSHSALSVAGAGYEAVVGRPFREAFAWVEGASEDPLALALDHGTAAEAEISCVDEAGRLRVHKVAARPMLGPGGTVDLVAVIRRDVTRRTAMERRLERSEKLAAIGELSTYIAHEIRNPLFAISGFANSLLRSPGLGEGARDKAAIILEESRRLDEILKSILNFTRPMAGRPGEGLADVNRVASETVGLFAGDCERLGVRVELSLAAGLPTVRAEAELLAQSLINVIRNSLEAMPQGGRLSVASSLAEGGVRLTVADTGSGISPEDLPKVFNPFFSTKGKGAGLGLAMIRKIVDDLGGRVELSSEPGEGTTVDLILPPLFADGERPREQGEPGASGRIP